VHQVGQLLRLYWDTRSAKHQLPIFTKFPMNGMPVETYNNTHLRTSMKWRQWRVHLRNQLHHQVRDDSVYCDRHMEMTTIQLFISRHRKWDKNSNCTNLHRNFGTCLPIYRVTWMFIFTTVRSSNFALGHYFLFFYWCLEIRKYTQHIRMKTTCHRNVLRLCMVGKSMVEEILKQESYIILNVH